VSRVDSTALPFLNLNLVPQSMEITIPDYIYEAIKTLEKEGAKVSARNVYAQISPAMRAGLPYAQCQLLVQAWKSQQKLAQQKIKAMSSNNLIDAIRQVAYSEDPSMALVQDLLKTYDSMKKTE
jgi:hypothetical protein